MSLKNNKVVTTFTGLKKYYTVPPFHPSEKFPEYKHDTVDNENPVYKWVRETLFNLGMDKENYNTPQWNPFKDLIQPGMTVYIKPNTVRHFHVGGGDVLSVITHASIVRPILDYVCIALNNEGRIIVGDSQVTEGLFDEAMVASQIKDLLDWYRDNTKVPLECYDMRINRCTRTWMYGKWGRKKIEQDPRGYTFVDLGDKSYFKDIDPSRLRIGIASYKEMYKHHCDGKHEYQFPNSFLTSDIVISIPKLKTHRRTAITIALKNFMGLPSLKDSLPHFITGTPEDGGDQYIHPSKRKDIILVLHDIIQTHPFIPVKFVCAVIKKLLWNSSKIIPFKDDIYEAMWYGNDTLWRTLLDLNRVAFYADKSGKVCDTPQRRHFCIVDGIISGEKDGPVSVDPVEAGVIMAGYNPVSVDAVASSLMGFDIDKIPLVKKGIEDADHASPVYFGKLDDITVVDNTEEMSFEEFKNKRNLKFEPHPNWKGHVER